GSGPEARDQRWWRGVGAAPAGALALAAGGLGRPAGAGLARERSGAARHRRVHRLLLPGGADQPFHRLGAPARGQGPGGEPPHRGAHRGHLRLALAGGGHLITRTVAARCGWVWLLVAAAGCNSEDPGVSLDMGLAHQQPGTSVSGLPRVVTGANGAVITVTRAWVNVGAVEILPCPATAWRRTLRFVSPIGIAEAHTT